ncbi:MAG: HK97 family phage prohead protease [Desulfurellales bacterium]|nr:MAG: HK97 family phage prohead protease [Desulfurellales bacterium]
MTATAPVKPRSDALGFESRVLNAAAAGLPLSIRAAGEDGSIPFTGYAAKFGRSSQDLGGFVEIIHAGAFAKTIGEADIRFVVNHDPSLVLARRRGESSDTLELAEDGIGLTVSARMAPTSYANDLAISVQRGDVSQMSFAFRTIRDDWEILPDGTYLRHLYEVALRDVSVVTYPAYLDTDAAIRSAALVSLEHALGLDELDAGRRAEALALLARGGEPAELVAAIRRLTESGSAGDEPPSNGQPATPAMSHLADIDRRMREYAAGDRFLARLEGARQ